MNENLSPLARRLLLAIHHLGAEPSRPFSTTVEALFAAVGECDADPEDFLEDLKEALLALVRDGVCIQRGGQSYTGSYLSSAEILEDSKVLLTVGVPRERVPDI